MEINHNQMQEIIKRAYKCKKPVDFKGRPGIGKSDGVKFAGCELASEEKRKLFEWNEMPLTDKIDLLNPGMLKDKFLLVDMRLSSRLQEDLTGFPRVDAKFAQWVPPLLVSVLSCPDAHGIFFLDEANHVPPTMSKILYQILNDHQIGEVPISKNVLILSCGNMITDKSTVFDEDRPVCNRRLNYTLKIPTLDEWIPWAVDHGVDMRIIGYLQWKQSNLFKFDADSKDLSFPSPRSWKMASDMINEITDLDDVKMYVAGAVGEGIAIEFCAFLKLRDKVDVKTILNNPKMREKYSGPDHIDTKYSIVTGIVEYYAKDKKVLDNVLAVTLYMEPEYGMFMLRLIKTMTKTEFGSMLTKCKNWAKASELFEKYLM
jgi:hypothetical protein